MKAEVSAAASFITRLLRAAGPLSEDELRRFGASLESALGEHYRHHWFPQTPCRGSGYRCIRINHKLDPLIGKAARTVGLSREQLFALLPSELTMWVDPYEVCYRIGEDGSICVLYESAPPVPLKEDRRTRCKEELHMGTASSSKSYSMMTVSG
ncbi:protein BTG1-like [Scleropages formosus]|uniref:Protein BTG1-like n=1 Tax=Scleropages formosus TaxID=113540 RepID=A0A0P7ZEU4_SCLFO|nr:protein BTG1-like [Scleropages formosus]XP_029103680.1 protein BTG1-like [Scleropages formosus]KPP79610.1 protein BTG1-like [Scleropages formosus]